MIKRSYQIISFILFFVLVITALLMIILSRPQLLEYIGQRYIKSEGVEYSHIKGSLFSKIILENVRYKDVFKAKELSVSYTLPLLLLKKPKISEVIIMDAKVKPKNFSLNGKSVLVPFSISKLELYRLKLQLKDEEFLINTTASKINYKDTVNIKNLNLSITSPKYGKLKLDGSFHENTLLGFAKLYPDKKYLTHLKSYPYPFKAKLKADKKGINLNTDISKLDIKEFEAKDINLTLKYLFSSDNIDFNSTYKIKKDTYLFKVNQKGALTTKGNFTSTLTSKILHSKIKLPFNDINTTLKGDSKKIALHVEAGLYKFDIKGDYKSFRIYGAAKGATLGLKGKSDIDMDSLIKLSPLLVDGNLSLKNQNNIYKTSYNFNKGTLNLSADIVQNNKRFLINTTASKINYKDTVNIKNLNLSITSPKYGKLKLDGSFHENTLLGFAKLYPDKKYLTHLKSYPYPFKAKLKADKKGINLNTDISKLDIKEFEAKDINLTLKYLFSSDNIDFNSTYKIKKDTYLFKVNQKGALTTKGNFTSTLTSKILHSKIKLPFNDINTTLKGDSKKIALHVEAGLYKFDIKGDYKSFRIYGAAKGATLGFLDNFPDIFKKDKIDMHTDAVLHISPLKLSGEFFAQSVAGRFKSKYNINLKSRLFETVFYPNQEYKLWRDYRVDKISPAKITIYSDKDSRVLNIDAKMLNVTLFRKKDVLGGWGNLATGYFNLNGKIDKKSGISLDINAKLASLRKFLLDVGVGGFNKNFYIDAKVNLKSKLDITKDILFKSKIEMPWYKVVLDNQNRYEGKNLWVESTFKNTQALISGYSFYILNHHIYSNRASKISLTKSGKIEFKEFWIFDNLLLKGVVDPLKKEGVLHLVGKNFRYEGKEGNVTANADITASLSPDGKQNIEGKITLLKGVVKVEPKKGYNVSDEDIIIIQNVHENRSLKRNINIQIESKNPINYEIKDLKLRFIPDFTIFQEEGGSLEYLGMLTIKNGEIVRSGKKFEIAKSEIYLRGANPINPYLNINLLYKAQDNVKIKVYIANTLSSPLMILASNPTMSQNDIMSYILFGKPANSAFQSSKGSQTSISLGTLLYGAGLKKMFQDTTHINIDTLNILSSKDKRFGYEVGASLNDKIRVIYKNDTISSIIVQYSLSKSIRIDVDVKESGEGVSILYAKDF